jgi:hypothetical protein
MPYQIETNPVSFHIPHLGKICTNNDNIDEKKKLIQKMFQQYFLPTELPHTAGITVEIYKDQLRYCYSAIVKFNDLSPRNYSLVDAYKHLSSETPLELFYTPKHYPIREGIPTYLHSFHKVYTN